jgi:hypothetical protein
MAKRYRILKNAQIDPEFDYEDDVSDDDSGMIGAAPKPANRPISIPDTKMLSRSRKRQAESVEDEAEKKIKVCTATLANQPHV